MRKNNNQTCLLHADQELEISFLPLIKGHAQLRTSSDPNATQSASVFKNGAVLVIHWTTQYKTFRHTSIFGMFWFHWLTSYL